MTDDKKTELREKIRSGLFFVLGLTLGAMGGAYIQSEYDKSKQAKPRIEASEKAPEKETSEKEASEKELNPDLNLEVILSEDRTKINKIKVDIPKETLAKWRMYKSLSIIIPEANQTAPFPIHSPGFSGATHSYKTPFALENSRYIVVGNNNGFPEILFNESLEDYVKR